MEKEVDTTISILEVETVTPVVGQLHGQMDDDLYQNLTEMMKKLEQFTHNKAIDDTSLITLLIFYAILIVFGVTGNGLVCAAVARKPSMRTGRNVYIINLAISDLLLCLFTMPFSLVEIALKFWPLGKNKKTFYLLYIYTLSIHLRQRK